MRMRVRSLSFGTVRQSGSPECHLAANPEAKGILSFIHLLVDC